MEMTKLKNMAHRLRISSIKATEASKSGYFSFHFSIPNKLVITIHCYLKSFVYYVIYIINKKLRLVQTNRLSLSTTLNFNRDLPSHKALSSSIIKKAFAHFSNYLNKFFLLVTLIVTFNIVPCINSKLLFFQIFPPGEHNSYREYS